MLSRFKYPSKFQSNPSLPTLIKSTSHSLESGINTTFKVNRIHFSIRQYQNKLSYQSIRLFTKHDYHRTHNRGLSAFWRNLGFNANPWKIAASGLLGGFFGALCGVGGGIVMIPILRTITTMTAHQIAGTSLVAVCVGAFFASGSYKFSGDVIRVPIALNMAMFSMAFAVLGSHVNARMLSAKALSRITGVSLICCIPLILLKYDPSIPAPGHKSVNTSELIRKHIAEDKFFDQNRIEWYKQNYHFCAIGCLAGFLSGLIGIGGGVVMTSVMAAFTDLSQHESVATSLLCIAPTSLIGSLVHYRNNHVVTPIALILGACCAAGMFSSSQLALEIKDAHLKIIFCSLLAVSAMRMLL